MARGRTIVFIDNSNMLHGQLDANWRVDIKKLHEYIAREGEIWQVYVFASVIDPPRYQQTNFYRFLKQEMRYEVLLFKLGKKTHECKNCGQQWVTSIEKGVDVALATKLLTLANAKAFDTAILLGADRDFLGTVQAVKALGLRVEVYAWKGTISDDMTAESSAPVVYLNDVKAQIELAGKPDEEAEKLASTEDAEAK